VPKPSVTIVFLVFNRRDELRISLRQMIEESDYGGDVEVIVVDNASQDGSAEMVEQEFPGVTLVRRSENVGVSGWNDGFAIARGDWVLALDDDCYLPPEGLRRAIDEAERRDADLVSFGVTSSFDPSHRFDQGYRTGLLTFWGCAVLLRRRVVDALTGYDPEIFVWANEVELMMRFFDRGFRHLYLPDVVAVHMKAPGGHWTSYVTAPTYRVNARNWAYAAAKLLRAGDAVGTLVALVAVSIRDALSVNVVAIGAVPEALRGFVRGMRRRRPVRPEVSRAYRLNFEAFASPWWMSRPLAELVRVAPRELARALRGAASGEAPPLERGGYYMTRPRFYPTESATLDFRETE
jgi:GT2 family glycosyltransferase